MLNRKVLVIDDERLIRNTTALLLRKEGAEPLCAANGAEGIELARKERPDLILLDIMMPGMDGWQVLEKLRTMPECSESAVIIFTAIDFTASEKDAVRCGAKGVLRKPFHLHELRALLATITSDEGGSHE